MRKLILIIFVLITLLQVAISQDECFLTGPSVVCNEERITIQYGTDATFTNVKINVVNGAQQLALIENKTDNSADIIFLAGGDAEILVRFFNGNTFVTLCNLNVFVFDETSIPVVGELSNFVDDQVTCEAIDLEFEMFIVCPDCPFYWTLNDEIIELEQQVSVDNLLQIINARLQIEGVGTYTFCHQILKQDSTCYIEDCITIDIVELDIVPSFSLNEEESIFCIGTSLQFINETIIEDDVFYIWEVEYDSLKWRYSGEDFDFDFLYPGEYTISLQYNILGDENCISDKTSMQVEIFDSPIIPITCSSNSCLDSIFTYQAPIDCEDYEWEIDKALGEILENNDSGITVKWNKVDKYTETKIRLFLGSCSENVCDQTFRNIILFPSSISIDGPRGICDKGTEWYEADLIPNAEYTWEIEMIDSTSGISPEITKLENNRVRITYNSFIGELAIRVNASIASKDCEVSGEITTTSLFINTNNDLCSGDLFKASVLPKIDQDVVWTLTNELTGYFRQMTLSGQDQFFAFDLNQAGIYNLNVAVPNLEFECGDDLLITILPSPAVILEGPLFVCPGDSVTYTLNGLGANDNVEWTIFQNNTSTDLVGNEITILWIEGGGPYSIKVSRSTEVSPGQFCDSESFVFAVEDIENQIFEIIGPEVLCYDAIDTFRISAYLGSYTWNIDPPFMGSIVDGDSTETVVIQWHYAPDIPFVTLSTSREICDSLYEASIDVYFEPYVPEIMMPDSTCENYTEKIEMVGLSSYQTIEYYVNDILFEEDDFEYDHTFQDTGHVTVRVEVVNPNGCPGVASISKTIYVIPQLKFNLITLSPLQQCPKDSFQDVIIEVDFQEPEGYYIWNIDDVIIKEGFGEADMYSFVITRDLILGGANGLGLEITYPGFCPGTSGISLDYDCTDIRCVCIDPVIAMVEYITPLECNLANFGGSLDFSTVIDPYWSIALGDTIIEIPIIGVEDLTQDSFYFLEGSSFAQVAIRGTCEGVTILNGEIIDTTLCEILIDVLSEPLYSPDFVREYICNEDLTYDIILTEKNLRNSSPPFSSTVSWTINGIAYEGISILLENQQGGSTLEIEMTQCSLDGSYCCTNNYETTVRKEFSPNIILPNGSCENDLWLFTLDVIKNDVVSILWDFGDGSGSTLFLTEKGFLDTLSHDISVVVTDKLGCVATSEITVKSFPNTIDGEIQFESDPCGPIAILNYIENSESSIITYEWDVINSLDTSSIQVNMSGDYSVTVTDNHGCTDIATVEDVKVNESFPGGMRFNEKNCGSAFVSIFANSDYSYEWYVDGVLTNNSSTLNILTPGEHEIKVVSILISSGEICDSITEDLVIFPFPEQPMVLVEKTFCAPFIFEMSLLNYPSAIWTSNIDIPIEGPSILVSQNGTYSASVEDENGCTNQVARVINEEEIPFDQLLDQCIQACREHLDSLSITIPGISESYSAWTWVTVDTFGNEYEISPSSGIVTPLTITSDMYEYIELQITKDDCILRSERIPLDIEICEQPEPPVEIICEPIDSDHASCGQSIYKCLLSEENGGPKLYFEGSVILPMGAVLCIEDSLSVSLNNGEIVITDLLFEEVDGKITVFYSANIVISDPENYKDNGTVVRFDFCDEDGELSHCYEYALPYRTCNKDFDCLIDFHGISSGGNMTVDVNYCLNLSEVIQENCTLSSYTIRAILSGDVSIKTIYTYTLEDDFDNLHCISIPVSYEDFYGGEFQCVELMIEGDCPDISCSEFQCGIFGNSNLVSNSNNSNPFKLDNDLEVDEMDKIEKIENNSEQAFSIYPNPSTGMITFEIGGKNVKDGINENNKRLVIKNTIGQIVKSIHLDHHNKHTENLSDQMPGLYLASLVQNGRVISVQKFLLVK